MLTSQKFSYRQKFSYTVSVTYARAIFLEEEQLSAWQHWYESYISRFTFIININVQQTYIAINLTKHFYVLDTGQNIRLIVLIEWSSLVLFHV